MTLGMVTPFYIQHQRHHERKVDKALLKLRTTLGKMMSKIEDVTDLTKEDKWVMKLMKRCSTS